MVVNRTLTAIRGIAVGHAEDAEAATGCTAVLGPFAAAVDVRGLATGSRELEVLSPRHVVPICDAILLTGGSVFGLAAVDGVVRWLEERGRGYQTSAAVVPIVPAAVIYDLGRGRPDVRPGPEMGYRAAAAASTAPVPEGRVGAGTGALVGTLYGPEHADAGGVGCWAEPDDEGTVAALAVVNAFGDVRDAHGAIIAGCRADSGSFVDTAAALRRGGSPGLGTAPRRPIPGSGAESTTLAVVAVEAPLDRTSLQLIARQSMNALVRRIVPSNTTFDGDLVFAVSPTDREPAPPSRAALLRLALRTEWALEQAIERAVTAAPRRAAPGMG